MAVIRKDRTPFRVDLASFAKRYSDHEAARLVAEAEQIIEELEGQLEDLAARQPAGQAVPDGAVEVLRNVAFPHGHSVEIVFESQESADRYHAAVDEAMKLQQNAAQPQGEKPTGLPPIDAPGVP